MPFWGGGWSNPYWEPKRPFRFVVPFPVIVPDEDETVSSIATLAASGRFPWNKYEGQTFDYPCTRCKKPSFSADLLRGTNVVGGFQPYLKNAPASYEFTPVELELVDTYNFDLEATLTAYLYGGGELYAPDNDGSAAPYISTPRPIPISNIGYDSPDFEIIELLDVTARHGPNISTAEDGTPQINATTLPPPVTSQGRPEQELFRARKFILKNALIAGVSFGEHSQDTSGLSTVSVQIVYDSYDYEWILYRPDPQWTQKRVKKRYQDAYVTVNPDSLSKAQLAALQEEWDKRDVSQDQAEKDWASGETQEKFSDEFERAMAIQNLSPSERKKLQEQAAADPEFADRWGDPDSVEGRRLNPGEAERRAGSDTGIGNPELNMTDEGRERLYESRLVQEGIEEMEAAAGSDVEDTAVQEEVFKEAVLAWKAGTSTSEQEAMAKSDPMETARVILETEASDREVEEQQSPAASLNAALDEELLEMAGDQATLHEPEVTPVPTEDLPVDAQGEQTGGRQPSEESPRAMADRIAQEDLERVAEDTLHDEGADEGDELGIVSDSLPAEADAAADPRSGRSDTEDIELDRSESLQSDEVNDAMDALENDAATDEQLELLRAQQPSPDDDGLTYDPAPEQIETPVPDDNETPYPLASPESEEIPSASAEVPGPTPAPDEPAADPSPSDSASPGDFGPEPDLAEGETVYTLPGAPDGSVFTAPIMGSTSTTDEETLTDMVQEPSQRRFDYLPLDTTTLSESLATGQEFHLVSGFGTRDGGDHRGFDARAQIGASAIAVGTGMVTFSGWSRGYGKTVIITLDDGYEVLYGHLSERSVEVGDIIASGQEIGLTGISGLDLSIPGTGPHLHFEVREPGGEMWADPGARGEIDPCPFFAQVGIPCA